MPAPETPNLDKLIENRKSDEYAMEGHGLRCLAPENLAMGRAILAADVALTDAAEAELAALKAEVERLRANDRQALALTKDLEESRQTVFELRAEVERLSECSTCMGQPHPSGKPCICDGMGATGEIAGLRALVLVTLPNEIATLRAKAALADEIAPALRGGHQWEDWLARYAALDARESNTNNPPRGGA